MRTSMKLLQPFLWCKMLLVLSYTLSCDARKEKPISASDVSSIIIISPSSLPPPPTPHPTPSPSPPLAFDSSDMVHHTVHSYPHQSYHLMQPSAPIPAPPPPYPIFHSTPMTPYPPNPIEYPVFQHPPPVPTPSPAETSGLNPSSAASALAQILIKAAHLAAVANTNGPDIPSFPPSSNDMVHSASELDLDATMIPHEGIMPSEMAHSFSPWSQLNLHPNLSKIARNHQYLQLMRRMYAMKKLQESMEQEEDMTSPSSSKDWDRLRMHFHALMDQHHQRLQRSGSFPPSSSSLPSSANLPNNFPAGSSSSPNAPGSSSPHSGSSGEIP